MTEKELRTFLEERKGTPEAIHNILEGISITAVQALYRSTKGIVLPVAMAEEIAAKQRLKFVTTILLSEGKEVPWHGFEALMD